MEGGLGEVNPRLSVRDGEVALSGRGGSGAWAIVRLMMSSRALLVLLSLGNLVIGSSAFVIGGLVGLIAEDLRVVPAAVGQAMTAYALATAFFAPLLVAASGRWRRKSALLAGLTLFTAGNALCAVAPNLALLLLGRALMGAGSMFTPLAAGIAVAVVAPEQRGKALSIVFMGMSLAYVVGLPVSTWVGAQHGWRAVMWLMTAANVVMLLAVWRLVPRDVNAPGAGFTGMAQVLAKPAVWRVMGTTMAYFTAIFAVVSYMAPVLQALAPMSDKQLSLTLMLFGLAGVAGTVVGGLAIDAVGPRRSLLLMLPLMCAAMLLLPLAQGRWWLMMVIMISWGLAGFSLMAPQQVLLAQAAPAHAPLLLSLNASMLYLGIALGAAVGGVALAPLGFAKVSWVSAPFALLALALVATSRGAASPGGRSS